jgi:hypothetical protein
VIAHHIIFHWNRMGLNYTAQANLALAAKQCAFNVGDDATPTRPATSAAHVTPLAPDSATDTF